MSKKKSGGVAQMGADYIEVPTWTREQLLAVKHLGPAIIGQAMYEAAQALVTETNDGHLGPALRGIIPEAYLDQRPEAVAARKAASTA